MNAATRISRTIAVVRMVARKASCSILTDRRPVMAANISEATRANAAASVGVARPV